MKVTVNVDLCTGHGRCYSLAPELFDADDSGFCAQRGTTFDIETEAGPRARQAALNCPEGAITIE